MRIKYNKDGSFNILDLTPEEYHTILSSICCVYNSYDMGGASEDEEKKILKRIIDAANDVENVKR